MDQDLLVRRINLAANRIVDQETAENTRKFQQLDLFTDYAALQKKQAQEDATLEREKHIQKALLDIKKRYGKNAVLKGMNLQEGATAKERNNQIVGHKA